MNSYVLAGIEEGRQAIVLLRLAELLPVYWTPS
jgi:hypothetical protein